MVKRTRNRVPTSCSNCRKKKAKCDRMRPTCGLCILRGISKSCSYHRDAKKRSRSSQGQNDSSFFSDVSYASEKKSLSGLFRSPGKECGDEMTNEELNEEAAATVGSTTQSISSDTSTNKKIVLPHTSFVLVESKLSNFFFTSYLSAFKNEKLAYGIWEQYFSFQRDIYADFSKTLDYPLPFRPIENPRSTNCDLLSSLPPIEKLKSEIDLFFSVSSILAPFMDQDTLTPLLFSILESKGSKTQIKQEQRESFVAAILLLILGFSHVINATGSNSFSFTKTSEDNSFSVGATYIEHASDMLLKTKSFDNFDLRFIQALLLLRIYKMCSPKSLDIASDIAFSQSILVSSARLLGMNMEFCNYPIDLIGEKGSIIWYSTWFYICYLDASFAFTYGYSPNVSKDELINLVADESSRPLSTSSYELMKRELKSLLLLLHYPGRKVILTEETILNSISSLSDILNDVDSFDGIIARSGDDTKPSFRASLVNEFLFRIQLLYRLFVLHYILFVNSLNDSSIDASGRLWYEYRSLELVLAIVRAAHTYSENFVNFFGESIGQLICSRVLNIARLTMPALSTFLISILKEKLNFKDALMNFVLPLDKSLILNWLKSDSLSPRNLGGIKLIVNLFKRLDSLLGISINLGKTYYAGFKLSVFLSKNLDYSSSSLNQLLKDNGYEEPLLLRNVHFTLWNDDIDLNEAYDHFLNNVQNLDQFVFNIHDLNI